ncbi:protein FAM174C isoform X1 [Mauremys reevesii]|uniref:protein FAM174C isoform X1 n=2 Tax=Mauremys reevesii TaxID=260615 RepID=UPI00193F3278|nr:protein FAM174C isoform X1 [Mauremys reevesii]
MVPRELGCLLLFLLGACAVSSSPGPGGTSPPPGTAANRTGPAGNHSDSGIRGRDLLGGRFPAVQRAFYVLTGLCALAALYFLVRALRLKKPQRKKYGLLSNYDENMELGSLDSDEDTVFETRNLRRSWKWEIENSIVGGLHVSFSLPALALQVLKSSFVPSWRLCIVFQSPSISRNLLLILAPTFPVLRTKQSFCCI